MTREEAIRILDPETTGEAMSEIEYYGGFSGRAAVVQAVLDACVLAVAYRGLHAEVFLLGVVLHRTIQNRIWIEVVQWAVVATRLPSHTILCHEVEAMTGECPTVMERPHHLDVRLVQIAEQQLIVQVVIMNVMEADDIRLQLLDMSDECLCCSS